MIKEQYKDELRFNDIVVLGDSGPQVERVQEWINLLKYNMQNWYTSVVADSQYGPQSIAAVKQLQVRLGLEQTGEVDATLWSHLTNPMYKAFLPTECGYNNVRDLIIEYANQQLRSNPKELRQNEGPWVRAYMAGHDGSPWAWCMGFTQTILDQAFSTLDQKFTDVMPSSFSCDIVGEYGLKHDRLIRNSKLRKATNIEVGEMVKPGDVFLRVSNRNSHDWKHTGIIEKVEGDWLHTIEGNTNDEGSREGYEACKRMRNFRTSNLDVYIIEKHG